MGNCSMVAVPASTRLIIGRQYGGKLSRAMMVSDESGSSARMTPAASTPAIPFPMITCLKATASLSRATLHERVFIPMRPSS